MEFVSTDRARQPRGHYSQATVASGRIVHVATQMPLAPGADPNPDASVEDQARAALTNVIEIVVAAGGRREDIARVMIQVTDMDTWGRVNEVYAELMGDHKPARGFINVAGLPFGFKVAM